MNGLMIGRLGVPGTGKSYFLRSAAALGKTAVAITRPSELDGYTSDIETEVFWDEQWLPSLDLFTATGYGKLLRWVNAQLAKPDVKVIGVDTGSDVSDLIRHDVLKLARSDDLKAAGEYGVGFTGHDNKLKEFLNLLQVAALRGKHVIVTWHVKMKEKEGTTPEPDRKGDVAFEERLLPVIATPFRQFVAGYFSLWLYSAPSNEGSTYFTMAKADLASPAKSRVKFKKEANLIRLPNEVQPLLNLLEGGK